MNLVCTRGARFEYRETEQGVDLFSVSQIRQVAHDPYKGIPLALLASAQARGTALHRRFWRVLAWRAGLCDVPPVIEALEGYCRSMDEWAIRTQVLPLKIEERSCSLKFGYAGTPDALVVFGKKIRTVLLDLKTGEPTVTDPMQLVFYKKMDGYEEAQDLLDLYIQKDGGYAIEKPVAPGQQAMEWAWGMAALGVLQGRMNHNCY